MSAGNLVRENRFLAVQTELRAAFITFSLVFVDGVTFPFSPLLTGHETASRECIA